MEVFVALWDTIRGCFKGQNLAKELKFLFIRVLVSVALREFITIGAKVDLARGLPIIHVNFLGYDEQSHRRGPNSLFAHWSLKGIDLRNSPALSRSAPLHPAGLPSVDLLRSRPGTNPLV